jgi:zinc transport system substrate-binding protein
MKQRIFFVFGVLLLSILLLVLALRVARRPAAPPSEKRLQIVATFYPLAFFAQEISKRHAQVKVLTPAGTDPHEYEPTPHDLVALSHAQLILINGLGLDNWASKYLQAKKELTARVLIMAEELPQYAQEEKLQELLRRDPHFWLDPVLAQKQVDLIAEALAATDSSAANQFHSRARELKARLQQLHEEFEKKLKHCRLRDIVTAHEAFSYLAYRYRFHVHAITGLSPEEEPSPRRLGELAEFIKQKKIKYVFFETLVSPRLAQTLAREAGVQTLVFHSLEGLRPEEKRAGNDYFTIQRQNLKNLVTALDCR